MVRLASLAHHWRRGESSRLPSESNHQHPHWHVYILRCADTSLYIGSTTDVARRMEEHATGKGGAYTRSRLPVTLLYQEPHLDRSTAERREAELKRWTRAKKLALAEGDLALLKQL